MNKVIKFTALIFLSIFIVLFSVGCNDFKRPPSTLITKTDIKLFNNIHFNNIGMSPFKMVINKDKSGHVEYVISETTLDEQLNAINTAIQLVNEKAYGEGEYLTGYRAVYVQNKNIIQKENYVSVLVEFSNINHLKSEISIKTVEEYLETNNSYEKSNNFVDIKTNNKTSIRKIEDKQNFFVVDCKNLSNQIPITIGDSTIYAYYAENSSDFLSATKDTIKFSTSDFSFVYSNNKTPSWLFIASLSLAIAFLLALTVKIIKSKSSKKLKI